jgi:16S rRNA C967 or C1407 C5-methylase (RsmB/RsmF family)
MCVVIIPGIFSLELDENRAKVMKTTKMSSEEAFDAFFAGVYGARWPGLREALEREPRKITLRNPFGRADYLLDEASLAPVRALDLRPGLAYADLCASPGGKSLAAICELRGEGTWLLNDLSPARVARLKAVLHDGLPPEIFGRVSVTRGDASRFGLRHRERFDRVLVDAPCSGERHLLASPRELARWSLKGSKRLAVRQHALLCAGLDSLRAGGVLVYSTCSISPFENDAVVRRLMESRAGLFTLRASEDGEATEFGRVLLPDRLGCGPIYFCVIEKESG